MGLVKQSKKINLSGIDYDCEYIMQNNAVKITSILIKQNKRMLSLNPSSCHPSVLAKLTEACLTT